MYAYANKGSVRTYANCQTLEPPSGFEHGTLGLGIQHLNYQAIALKVINKLDVLVRSY